MYRQLLAAFIFTFAYAFIRYAGFGHVTLNHLPAYIMNKAICMTAVESMFMATFCLKRKERDSFRFWTGASLQLAFVHVALSLGILSQGYYPNFFDGDKMSLTGELVLLMGALAAYCFWRLHAAGTKPSVRRMLTALAFVFVSAHLFAMGYRDTMQVEKWNGGLPPMSFLSFVLAVTGLAVYMLARDMRVPLSAGEGPVLPSESRPGQEGI